MPIQLVESDDRTAVLVFCDHCHGQIKSADDGNYEWSQSEDASRNDPSRHMSPFFTHKKCSEAFRAVHPAINKSSELAVFLVYLCNNIELDFARAVETAKLG